MFNFNGITHVIHNPKGAFSLVGSVPTAMMEQRRITSCASPTLRIVADFHSLTDDKEDAARWADSMAEGYAEREREWQAKEEAKTRLKGIDAKIKEEYAALRREQHRIEENGMEYED